MQEAIEALLREHMQREDRMPYRMALGALPQAELAGLAASYGVLESEIMGAGKHGKLHALARELIATHPPGPERMKPCATRIVCVEHLSQ